MQDLQLLRNETIAQRFMEELENTALYEGVDSFFQLEDKLVYQVNHTESDKAKATLRKIIDFISTTSGKRTIKEVRHYFLVISAIMARNLYENHVPSKKVYAFNVACADMIQNKMKDAEFLQFADDLIDFFIEVVAERKHPAFNHQTVNRVIVYINDGIETELSVEDLAKQFQVSTSHLSRIFREHVGITLVEYLNVRRVEEAQYYLRHTKKNILDISKQFHFCNQSYFTRIFKKYTGVTPKQFRDNKEHDYFRFVLPMEM